MSTSDTQVKHLKTAKTKHCKLVFDKRVVDPESFQSCPYGYNGLDDTDLKNIDNLFAL